VARLPGREPSAVRAHLREQIHAAYNRRRAVFPVEWIIEEAYARPAHAGGHDIRTGHAMVAGWANAKYACRWTAESVEQTYGSDIQKIGDALLAMQYEYLMPKDGEGPLAREVDQAIERCAGRPAKLRQWARERFRDALDESIFDTAQDGTAGHAAAANLRDALIEAGREWLCWEFNRFECALLLRSYDEAWMDHLLEMDHLKYAIMQRPLGGDQTHPQSQYAIEGREYFEKMWGRIRGLVLDRILRVRPSGAVEGRSIYQAVEVRHDEAVGAGFKGVTGVERQPGLEAQGEVRVTDPIRRTQPRVKPNDPCPCGSGKKYKKCHGSRAASK
ncbi:MAG TPA: SEC-C metal-binding domain-containing protein, partial [Phycisphaerae bacterium]|nr:SEC-C metal-binding domain-containing protein [Phycisphaerae bacterium]